MASSAVEQKQQLDWDTVEKHPLQSKWAFWYDDHKKSADFKQYQQGLVQVSEFQTVEDFWRSFSYLTKPDTLQSQQSVYLTRNGATPAWESFPKGGCWILRVRKKNLLIDRLWEELVFACIAELFELPDIVCVGVSTRLREDVLSIWNVDNTNPNTRFIIGEKLRSLLNLDATTNVEYKTFQLAIKDKSSFNNNTKAYGYIAPPNLAGLQTNVPTDKKNGDKKKTATKSGDNKKKTATAAKDNVEFTLPTVYVEDKQ